MKRYAPTRNKRPQPQYRHITGYLFVLAAYAVWSCALFCIARVSTVWWPQKFLFLGSSPWANFDGFQYVVIANQGYLQYQQAYFPLYPALIAGIHRVFPGILTTTIALGVSRIAFLSGLMMFYSWARRFGETAARWAVLLLLSYPAAYYFAGAYTESLFFLFAAVMLLSADRKQYAVAAFAAMLASATRLFGIVLFPYLVWHAYRNKKRGSALLVTLLAPLGLVFYMAYLHYTTGDPLAFVHVQPKFGANRTGGGIILLPQVLYRYIRIFLTGSPATFPFWVSVLELGSFLYAGTLAVVGFMRPKLRMLSVYSAAILILPTLTGTLSSLPRYVLSAFPLFLVAAVTVNERMKYGIMIAGILLETVLASLFLAGYFVS